MAGSLRVTLRKSVVSSTQRTRGTVRALGLHRIGQTVEVPDNPATRGMVRAVRHLLVAEEGTASRTRGRRASSEPPTAVAQPTTDAVERTTTEAVESTEATRDAKVTRAASTKSQSGDAGTATPTRARRARAPKSETKP
jgi:large subunit ribosomal protein L30